MTKYIFITLFSNLLSLVSVGPIKPTNPFDNFFMTPLSLENKATQVSYTAKGTSKAPIRIEISIINDYYPNGINLISKIYTTTTNESFTYNNQYTRVNNTINLKIIDISSGKEINYSTAVTIHLGENVSINDPSYVYSSKNKCITYKSGSPIKQVSQKITFSNFTDTYAPNFYHKIDLSDFSITADKTYINYLSYTGANLVITNRNGVFNSFNHNDNNAYFPLKLIDTGKEYCLGLENPVYVNKLTLEMSSLQKEGFVETKYIYFPRNEKQYEGEYRCSISINGVGIDNNTYILNFGYKSESNIIGDCRNSEYCVINNRL